MQRISDHLKISPGNLTYHFPKKEDLMLAIYELFQSEMSDIVPQGEINKPDLVQLDDQIRSFYQLQQRFLFFYVDLLEVERAYPELANKHQEHIKNQIDSLNSGLIYNVSAGYLDAEKSEMDYQYLAEQLWFTAVFWPRQILVRGMSDSLQNMRLTLWQLIKPYLSTEGIQQLNNILFSNHLSKTNN